MVAEVVPDDETECDCVSVKEVVLEWLNVPVEEVVDEIDEVTVDDDETLVVKELDDEELTDAVVVGVNATYPAHVTGTAARPRK